MNRLFQSRTLSCLLLFAVAFGARVLVSAIYVHHYDTYDPTDPEQPTPYKVHSMIKSDSIIYYRDAHEIVEDIREGRNPFLTGPSNYYSFLYSRVVALYGLLTGKLDLGPNLFVPLGQVGGFFVFQSFLFALCLIPIFLVLRRLLGIKWAWGSALFLSLEPVLLQYNAMMLTETLFIGILALVLSAWGMFLSLKTDARPGHLLLLFALFGILSGLLFLERTVALLFPAVLLITCALGRLLGKIKHQLAGPSLAMIVTFGLVLLSLGLHNFYRAGLFYIVPMEINQAWYIYFADRVMADVNNSAPDQERKILVQLAADTAKKRGLIPPEATGESNDPSLNEGHLYELYKIYRELAFNIFRTHPWPTIKVALFSTAKSISVDPFYTYRLYSNVYKPSDEEMNQIQLQQHSAQKPLRIVYSLIILVPVLFGWLAGRRFVPWPFHLFCTLSMLYFIVTSGWLGFPRVTLPNFVFYTVYWPIGMARFFCRGSLEEAG